MANEINSLQMMYWNNLAKYATGAAINHTDTPPYEAVGGMLIFQSGAWTWANRKDFKGGFQALGKEAQANKTLMALARGNTKGIGGISKGTKNIIAKDALINFSKSIQKGIDYKDVRNAANTALNTKNYSVLKDLEKQKAEANLKHYKRKTKLQRTSGKKVTKTLRAVKDKTGITKLNTMNKSLLANSSKYRALGKGIKGGGAMAIISAACEVPNVIETYNTLGKEAGNKQLRKSAINVAAETAGWIAGAKAGAAVGASVGTCIGGPIGTVVGGVIGVAGGLLGCWLAGKAARKIQGKDELELAREAQANQISQELKNNTKVQKEVLLAAVEQLQSEGENLSEDGKTAKKSLEKIIGSLPDDYFTDELADTTSEETAAKISSNTAITDTTVKTQTTEETDTGLKALYALANGSSSGNLSGYNYYNPFLSGYNYFNSFGNTNSYFNPFLMSSMTNSYYPFGNSFNIYNPYSSIKKPA